MHALIMMRASTCFQLLQPCSVRVPSDFLATAPILPVLLAAQIPYIIDRLKQQLAPGIIELMTLTYTKLQGNAIELASLILEQFN